MDRLHGPGCKPRSITTLCAFMKDLCKCAHEALELLMGQMVDSGGCGSSAAAVKQTALTIGTMRTDKRRAYTDHVAAMDIVRQHGMGLLLRNRAS